MQSLSSPLGDPVPAPRISRFEDMGFGLFIHWGLYSTIGRGEWALHAHKLDRGQYRQRIGDFTARHFDPAAWARSAKGAGMKYAVLTTRHHEGFSLYDTRGLSDFDAMHSPAGRDLVKEFVEACRDAGLMPVLYHTTLDWMEPRYRTDFDAYLEYLRRSVEILCTRYGPIGGLWFDGNWDRPGADWKLNELYGMIRRLQPEALIINNTGLNARGELGHPEIDCVTFEQGLPRPLDRRGMAKYIAGEMCETMGAHWGLAEDFDYKSTRTLLENLCACRKAGANYLLNVGPDGEGRILPMQAATLGVIGDWMRLYGEAIYHGRPSAIRGSGKDFALEAADGRIWLFIHDSSVKSNANVTLEGENESLRIFGGLDRPIKSLRWMDNGEELEFIQGARPGLLGLRAPGFDYGSQYVVRVAELIPAD